MRLKFLIYPLRIFYILLLAIGLCAIPILTVVMCLTPILDVFGYIATGKLRVMDTFCDWYFEKFPDYYLIYLKPENVLKKIENK